MPRAFVAMQTTPNDLALWDVMDNAMKQVADLFANGQPVQTIQALARDGLGTTHHETGTLWMGTDPASVIPSAGSYTPLDLVA